MDSIENSLLICDVNIHVTIYVIVIHLLTIGLSFPFPTGTSVPFNAKLVDFLKV